MTVIPDFGYNNDNFLLDRGQEAPRNWKLLTDFIWNQEKYEWLTNHIQLRELKKKLQQKEEKKKARLNKKQTFIQRTQEDLNQQQAATATKDENKKLEILKEMLRQDSAFLNKFKMMNNRGSSRQNLNSPQSKTRRRESVRQSSLSQVRKSLIDRQVEHATLNKSQASLSPIHQLRNIELQQSNQRGLGATSRVAFFTTVQDSRAEVGVS